MGDKILVAYATAAGSTAEVAEAIGKALDDGTVGVDVRPAGEVTDLGTYRAAVLGSGIRAGNPYREAKAFVDRHQQALSQMPVAYFAVCMTMGKDTEENRQEAASYLQPLRDKAPQVEPVSVGLFGGVMDFSKLSWLMRLIIKGMKGEEGDVRDWEAIRAWAVDLRPALMEG